MLYKKRSSGLFVFSVQGANPNGNIDNGLPRQCLDGEGLVSAPSLKRKFRNLFEEHDSPVFQEIVKKFEIDPSKFFISESGHRGFPQLLEVGKSNTPEVRQAAFNEVRANPDGYVERCYDIRLFGTTFLEKRDKGKGKKGDQGDQDSEEVPVKPKSKPKSNSASKPKSSDVEEKVEPASLKRAASVSLSHATSVGALDDVIEEGLSKAYPLRPGIVHDLAPNAMNFVPFGLYYCWIDVNPNFAWANRLTEVDVAIFKAVFPRIFDFSNSSSRPAGTICPVHFWWKDHASLLGTLSSRVRQQITPRLTNAGVPGKSMADYVIPDAAEFGMTDLLVEAEALWS